MYNRRYEQRRMSKKAVCGVSVLSIVGSASLISAASDGAYDHTQLRGDIILPRELRNVRGRDRRIMQQTIYAPQDMKISHQRPSIAVDIQRRGQFIPPPPNEPPPLQIITPTKYNPLTPYYPNLITHTCHADHNYPEYYLYDINAYFSHSSRTCCELHFAGVDVEYCNQDVGADASIIQQTIDAGVDDDIVLADMVVMNGMIKKKEAYRLDDVMLAQKESGGIYGDDAGGTKKLMMHHDTSSYVEDKAHDHASSTTKAGKTKSSKHQKGSKIASSSSESVSSSLSSESTYNYCGTSFVNANINCDTPCPSGTDADCPQGETCFANVDACPATVGVLDKCKQRRVLQWDYEYDEYDHNGEYDDDYYDSKSSKGAKSKASKMSKSTKSKTAKSKIAKVQHYDPTCSPTHAPIMSSPELSSSPTAPATQFMSMPSIGPYGDATNSPTLKDSGTGVGSTFAPTSNTYSPTLVLMSMSMSMASFSPSTEIPVVENDTDSPSSLTISTYPTYSPDATYYPTQEGSGSGSGGSSWGGGWGGGKMPSHTPTMSGSWGGGWGGGGGKIPTYHPTQRTYAPTMTITTYYPTTSQTEESISPTTDGTILPTIEPTTEPTTEPTMDDLTTELPTMSGTIGPPLDLLVWGSPLSTSQSEDNGNILIPLDIDISGIDASAGTRYSVIIYPDGRAFSTGYITDPNGSDYHGHLGIRPEVLVDGQNMFNEIDRAYDPNEGGLTFPPRFKKAFAGVENSEGMGDIHTILLDTKGNAWATGSNSAGQLCVGDTLDKLIPQRIPLQNIVDVAIGGQHTLLLDSEGIIYGCGSNAVGQLGLEDSEAESLIPVKLDIQVPATSISAGKDHSLIIAENGIYTMGSNEYGQLCVDTQGENIVTPSAFDVEEKVVAAFKATRESSYILYDDGSVNSCGRNNFGQLGDGTEEDAFLATVTFPEGTNVVRLLGVGPSSYSAFFVTEDEIVYGTGSNDYGQLGVGDEENRNVPTLIKLQDGVEVFILSSAEDHTLALKEGGIDGTFPTLAPMGGGSYAPTIAPTMESTVVVITDSPTIQVIPTLNPTVTETFAPTQTGLEYFFWGAPEAVGQPLDTPDVLTPLNVGDGIIFSGAGTKYTVLILKDGSALAAGYIESIDDYEGHMGIDQTKLIQGVNEFQPIDQVYDFAKGMDNATMSLVDAPIFDKVFLGVESTPNTGQIHTILLDKDGNAWATGNNMVGQLCLGDEVDRMIPEKISIEGKVTDVAVGGEHTLLLLEDGSVYGCGSNTNGQLGLGDSVAGTTGMTATKIEGLSEVSSVSAGHSHSLFMAADGIYLSGSNEYGQMCVDNNGENVLSPKALEVEERVVIAFEAIKESSFILYEDGSVNSCGRNDFGQLGDGTNNDQFTTTSKTTDTIVRLLGVGPSAQSVFFVTSDEVVLGTGLNDRGQLGVGDTDNRNIPTQVKFDSQVSIDQLYVSEIHSVAIGTTLGSLSPTLAPSVGTSSPTRTGRNMYVWGAPDSFGEADPEDILIPLVTGDNAIDVSGGSKYTVIVLNDGTALSSGYIDSLDNYQGHLGRDEQDVVQGVNEMMPISFVYDSTNLAITEAPQFDKVFAGVENQPGYGVIHTVLLDAQGRVWATGSNKNGQLCLGENITMVTIPEAIPIEGKVIDVAIGGAHTLLLLDDGSVYGCGSNAVGQLGLGTTLEKVSVPTIIEGLASITSISSGHSHSVFLSDDNAFFTGSNEFGQLCEDTSSDDVFTPGSLDELPSIDRVIQFEAIMSSSYILFDDGSVLSCGNNEFGQLGDGTTLDGVVKLVQLDGVIRMLGVGPSAESVFFVTDDEVVWGTGLNDRGQLGTGDTDNREVPSPVQFEERVILEVLSASGDHTVAIGSSEGTFEPTKAPSVTPTEGIDTQSPTVAPTLSTTSESPTSLETETTGTLAPTAPVIEAEMYYWGSSGSVGESANDILVPFDSDIVASDVSAGSKYTIVILSDGTAQTGGFVDSLDSYKGHLGVLQPDVLAGENPLKAIENVFDNDVVVTAPDLPFFIKAFAGAEEIESSGTIHSILLDKDGQAWATGSNDMGQLCLGDTDERFIPQRIPVDGKVISAAVGSEHTLLLLEDGSVYGCGSNMAGQLGLGDTVVSTTGDVATKIEGLPFVRSVSAGLSFSLFIAEDGLYATGSNLYGQLCDGETIGANVTTPYRLVDPDPNVGFISVDTVSSFMAIKTSSFILFNDGGVAACGRNEFGQLGDGETKDPPSARTVIQLPDNLKIIMIGVGPSAESAFFISDDNQVWGTGLNNHGQLGVDDTEDRNTPMPLKFEGPIVARVLSAAGDHTVALGYIDGSLAPTIAPAAGISSATEAPSLDTSDLTTNSPTESLSQSPLPTSVDPETDLTTNNPTGLVDNNPIPPTLTIVSEPPTSSDLSMSMNTPTGVPTMPINISEESQFPTSPPEEVSVSSSPTNSVS